MNESPVYSQIKTSLPMTTEHALALFDQLDSVTVDDMLGRWRGDDFPTQHPMDGLLSCFYWYGKDFCQPEHVYPLLHKSPNGKMFYINPSFIPVGLLDKSWLPRGAWIGWLFLRLRGLFTTSASKARVRMTEYRGKTSATMIYDCLPINDVFRKIDDNTVLGLMDRKGATQPFFFLLHRDHSGAQ